MNHKLGLIMMYKQLWQDKYDEAEDEGLDELEACQAADNYVQDYIEQKADYELMRRKEEREQRG